MISPDSHWPVGIPPFGRSSCLIRRLHVLLLLVLLHGVRWARHPRAGPGLGPWRRSHPVTVDIFTRIEWLGRDRRKRQRHGASYEKLSVTIADGADKGGGSAPPGFSGTQRDPGDRAQRPGHLASTSVSTSPETNRDHMSARLPAEPRSRFSSPTASLNARDLSQAAAVGTRGAQLPSPPTPNPASLSVLRQPAPGSPSLFLFLLVSAPPSAASRSRSQWR